MVSSFKQILEDIIETEKWLKLIGIETRNTRIESIIKKMHQLTEVDFNASNPDKITHKKFGNDGQEAVSEAFSLNLIRKGLEKFDKNKLPKKKLKEIIKGPFFSTEETPGDSNVNPRNTMFELELASRMILAGLNVIRFEDVEVSYKGLIIPIQCKRLFSESNIAYNAHIAYEQLKARNNIHKDNNKRGIIALSIEKVDKLDEKILLANDYESALKILQPEIFKFYETHNKKFERYYGLRNFWGIIFYTKYDVYIIDISTISTIEGLHMQLFVNPHDRNCYNEVNIAKQFFQKVLTMQE